jgi:hypothetical protein
MMFDMHVSIVVAKTFVMSAIGNNTATGGKESDSAGQ